MVGDDVRKELEDQLRQLHEKKWVAEEKKEEERNEAIFWWAASEA